LLYSAPKHRRPGGTLYRAVVREVAAPAALALCALTLVLLTQDLIGFSELVINRGLAARSVAWLAFYELVPRVSLSLPFACLVGCLVGLGRMGADRELLVLEASGISSPRLIGPVLTFAGGVTILGLLLSLYAAPWSVRSLDKAVEAFSRESPGATLRAGVIQEFGDWKLEAREVSASGRELEGVLMWMPDLGETVFARRGLLTPDPEGSRIELEDGTVVLEPRKRPRQIRFDQIEIRLPRDRADSWAPTQDRLAGLSLRELALAASGDSTPQRARIELQRRLALPFGTLVLGLLAVPLFFSRAHYSRAGGGVMGIAATLVYYGLVQVGDGLIWSGQVSPLFGVWLPNLVIGAVGLAMAFRLTRISSLGRHLDRPEETQHEEKPERVARSARSHRRALPRYVATRFLELALICFGGLLTAYLLVDLLERLDFFADYQPTAIQFLKLYAGRLPVLAARVIPMALLLATALTVSLLNARGELLGMRSCGIPAPVALAPVMILCTLLTPLYFVFTDTVVPRANAYYYYMKHEAIRGWRSESAFRNTIWYRRGDQVFEADSLDSRAGRATNLRVYELDDEGRPTSRLDATSASHIGDGIWRLSDPIRVELKEDSITRVPALRYATLGEGMEVRVDSRDLSVRELAREIEEVEDSGYDAWAFHVAWWGRWAAPLGCLVLPALALIFAVGGPPFPNTPITICFSVLTAVGYVLLTGVATSLGNGRVLAPAVAAFVPAATFGAVAVALGFRLRNLGFR